MTNYRIETIHCQICDNHFEVANILLPANGYYSQITSGKCPQCGMVFASDVQSKSFGSKWRFSMIELLVPEGVMLVVDEREQNLDFGLSHAICM